MESEDGADERGQVDHQHLVVGLGGQGLDKVVEVHVRKEVEYILGAAESRGKEGEIESLTLMTYQRHHLKVGVTTAARRD